VLVEIAIDGRLQVDDGTEHAALELFASERREKVSAAFSQEPEVGVTWKTQRGCRTSHCRAIWCLGTA
jgi:hypothetical protein